ncbi:MAG: hypothetical protein JW746_01515 [Candidatus Krumholzibacteriota bacterium]|nr:hypothetical protein [Candidatus Krumholzibacteriota bacterium]
MPDDLKLSLKREEPQRSSPMRLVNLLLIITVVLVAMNLMMRIGGWQMDRRGSSGMSAGLLEEHALKLEKQQLYSAAARAWTEYLELESPGSREQAGIWFRIGKLYQDAGDFERALDAYYRSEAIAEVKEIESAISLRVSECLERLGRFAALRGELESRTAVDPESAGSDEIVAEIGSWKISRSSLETMIEAEIDAQLGQAAGRLSPDEIRKQKEKLLGSVLKEGELGKWLDRFIAEELVYRLAMEERLYESAEYRKMIRDIEKKLIVQKRLQQEYAELITVTDEELRDWYEKNKERFSEDGNIKSFEESAEQVYAAVHLEKEMQVQSQLIGELIDKYDVVIHSSSLEKGGE